MSAARVFQGATLLHLDPPRVEVADVRVEGGVITAVGPGLPTAGAEVVDVKGRWLMPGLTCGHHHLYSALACGMPLPVRAPQSFTEMLQEVWWRLDRALDEEGVIVSGLVGGVDALKAGVTTVIDHHASPSFIEGSLEALDGALDEVGLRRVLCYEVTDRGTPAQAEAGLKAHLGLLRAGPSPMRATLVGGHANFTMSDETLAAAARLAREHGVGLHIHVAEATDDEQAVGEPLIARMKRLDALLEDSLFAHCVHLSGDELKTLADHGVRATHQGRSNMNNGVGRAPVSAYPPGSILGTDGIGADMIGELQATYFRSQEAGEGLGPADFLKLLTEGSAYASRQLGVRLGRLEAGYQADLVALDPCPGPPLRDGNLAAAFVFRFRSAQVRSVWVAGAPRLLDRRVLGVDEATLGARAEKAAEALWTRMREQGAGV